MLDILLRAIGCLVSVNEEQLGIHGPIELVQVLHVLAFLLGNIKRHYKFMGGGGTYLLCSFFRSLFR